MMIDITDYLGLPLMVVEGINSIAFLNTHTLLGNFSLGSMTATLDPNWAYLSMGIGTALFFLTTLFTDTSKFTTLRTATTDFSELQKLKAVIERKTVQLEEANELIERQSFLLKKYGVNICGGLEVHAEKLEKLFNSVLLTEHSWSEFKKTFDTVHYGFLTSLKMKYADLTEGEKRLAVLIKLNISTKDMARMLGISPNSIIKSRYRLKKKLCKFSPEKSLEEIILEI